MSHDSNDDKDLVLFTEEEASLFPTAVATESFWSVLVVDDEIGVHEATRYALKDYLILDRPVRFFSAYSADEARKMLQSQPQFACILLDVVMESDDAGLNLVSYIRETLEESSTRIILRTGQPGYAPELEVISKYDINDYKCKSELTRSRLITTLTAAIRSYHQIKTIETNRQGLNLIIQSASGLFLERAVHTFARGVLMQLCSMLNIDENGFLCCHEDAQDNQVKVLAGLGRYADLVGSTVEALNDEKLLKEISHALASRENIIDVDHVIFYMSSPHGDELVVRIETLRPLSDMDIKLVELFSVNISVGFDNARMFERIERLAFVDHLTGLPNRTAFAQILGHYIKGKAPFMLLMADIDNFQSINDGLGRAIGDQTLMMTGARLEQFFGEGCELARVSADTFCFILTDMNINKLEIHLRKLKKSLDHGLTIDNYEVPVSLTLGIALYPDHGNDAETLLQNASIALKNAKRKLRAGFSVFNIEFERALQQRLEIARELHHCVTQGELLLHFQPQVSLIKRGVIGAEALVRWRRHGGDLMSPLLFIPAAESSGHILAIGAWVMEEACRQQQIWVHRTGKELVVAVNVSMRQLVDVDFISMMDDVLRRTSINPGMLELEVTETVMMENSESVGEVLLQLRDRGLQVAIDDFGTGYSSLSYLQQLTVDRLKIDQSFVRGLAHRVEDQVIAALIIKMGHLLNIKVIAEGVETQEQQNELLKLGCDDAQGYLYAKPMESHLLMDFISGYGK
ncbi:bifunctional diguanylate cyclase/phosphodiesterase [Nitrincola sp. MINF-07-Sa-05]|uniref:bifunctional diguanylate cyclase/phosphodiesterase n=1 Tax=Nitrincola salilacus TaxID=3400273 RepID=UPI0039186253